MDSLVSCYLNLVPQHGGFPPKLRTQLRRLDLALELGDLESACLEVRQALAELIVYYTSVTSGCVVTFMSTRPEISALASTLQSLTSYERLLRFSTRVLAERPPHLRHQQVILRILAILTSDPVLAQWLGLAELSPTSVLPAPLSITHDDLGTAQNLNSSPQERLGQYLPLLAKWLEQSREFFGDFSRVLEHKTRKLSVQVLSPGGPAPDLWTGLLPFRQENRLRLHSQLAQDQAQMLTPLQGDGGIKLLPALHFDQTDVEEALSTPSQAVLVANELPEPDPFPGPGATEEHLSPLKLSMTVNDLTGGPLAELEAAIAPPSTISTISVAIERIPTVEATFQLPQLQSNQSSPATRSLFQTMLMPKILGGLLDSSQGYLVLEGGQGAGKSSLARELVDSLNQRAQQEWAEDESHNLCRAFYFSIHQHLRGDFLTCIEILDERIARAQHITQLRSMGSWVTRDLNVQYPGAWCSERFFSYLARLRTVNQCRVLLVLDGLDETFEGSESQYFLDDFLPETLPEGIYIVLTCHRDSCSTRLSHKVQSLMTRGARDFTLHSSQAEYRTWRLEHLQIGRFLAGSIAPNLRLRPWLNHRYELQRSFPDIGFVELPDEEVFPTAFQAIVGRYGQNALEMLVSFTCAVGGFTSSELALLDILQPSLDSILRDWPSLFSRQSKLVETFRGDNVEVSVLTLSHDNMRGALLENYPTVYARCCYNLATRASQYFKEQFAEIDPDPTRSLSIDPARLIKRLYSWLLECQDFDLQKTLMQDRDLKRLRDRLCNQMEGQGQFHEKLAILAHVRHILHQLLKRRTGNEHSTIDDFFREELAWTYNARALTYLRLGQFQRSLDEVEEAILMFRFLIEDRGCEQYRKGLAAAQNRRSEALLAIGNASASLESAQLSVENFRRVVQENYRLDQLPFLALALYQRAKANLRTFEPDQTLIPVHTEGLQPVLTDLSEAVQLYGQLAVNLRQQESQEPLEAFDDFDDEDGYRPPPPPPKPKVSAQNRQSQLRIRANYLQTLALQGQVFYSLGRLSEAQRILDAAYTICSQLLEPQETYLSVPLGQVDPLDLRPERTGSGEPDLLAFETDLSRIEAEVLTLQALVYHHQAAYYDALDCCDEAERRLIYQVTSGRVDLRRHYTQLLVLRSEIWTNLEGYDQALDDLGQAAQQLTYVIESETDPALFLQRSKIYRKKATLLERTQREVNLGSDMGGPGTGLFEGGSSTSSKVELGHNTPASVELAHSQQPWEDALSQLELAAEDILRTLALAKSSQRREKPNTFEEGTFASLFHTKALVPQMELAFNYHRQGQLLKRFKFYGRAADRFGESIALLQGEASQFLALSGALMERADCFRRLGQLEVALADYQQAIDLLLPRLDETPHCKQPLARAHLEKARILEQLGEFTKASREASLALRMDAVEYFNRPELLLLRARLYLAEGHDSEAVADTDEALSLLSGQPAQNLTVRLMLIESWKLKSRIEQQKGKHAEALSNLENAMAVAELSQLEIQTHVRDGIAVDVCRLLMQTNQIVAAGERAFEIWGGRSAESQAKTLLEQLANSTTLQAKVSMHHRNWRQADRELDLALRLNQTLLIPNSLESESAFHNLQTAKLWSWRAHCCLGLIAADSVDRNEDSDSKIRLLKTQAVAHLREGIRRLTKDVVCAKLPSDGLKIWADQLIWCAQQAATLEFELNHQLEAVDILLESERLLMSSIPLAQKYGIPVPNLTKLRDLLRGQLIVVFENPPVECEELSEEAIDQLHAELVRLCQIAIANPDPTVQLESLLILDRCSSNEDVHYLEQADAIRKTLPDGTATVQVLQFHLQNFLKRRNLANFVCIAQLVTAPGFRASRNLYQVLGGFEATLGCYLQLRAESSPLPAEQTDYCEGILWLTYQNTPPQLDATQVPALVNELVKATDYADLWHQKLFLYGLVCDILRPHIEEIELCRRLLVVLQHSLETMISQHAAQAHPQAPASYKYPQKTTTDRSVQLIGYSLSQLASIAKPNSPFASQHSAKIGPPLNLLAKTGGKLPAEWCTRLGLDKQVFWDLRQW